MNKMNKLKKRKRIIIFLLFPLFFLSVGLNAQNFTIKGKVMDQDGNVLPGAVVRVQGSTTGVSVNDEGDYVLNAVPKGSVLEFLLVGYVTQEIRVAGDKTVINAILSEAAESLEDVTVVAFGTQKKESVIGSITTINPAELKIPSSNLTAALAGNMAGIIAYQRSGEPGRDNADFFVRGITTFGANTNPLILIDNVELTSTDLARLQPDDIASFSIMKDATATALYGARGANGVILVTTKRGSDGPAKIFVRLENSISTPTRNIELADPITFMKLHNEAVLTRDPLGELPYSKDKIENTLQPGYSPYIYPANDWYRMLFRDYAINQRANLSVSGGSSVARYYVSGAFTQDNGVLKVDKRNSFNNNIDFKNYNLRANVDVNITKKTELSVRLTGNFDNYTGPVNSGEAVYDMVVHSNPVLFPAYYPVDEDFKYVKHIMFGNVASIYTNPYAEMVRGYQDRSRSQMLAQLAINQNLDFITKGLSLRSLMNISRLAEFSVSRAYNPYWYRLLDNYDSFTGEYHLERINENGTEYLVYSESPKTVESTMYTETALNYDNTFGKHNASALLVFMTREALAANQGNMQLSLPSRNVGISGRATYSFDSRYFVEFNFGYNGSERFAVNHRWGFFPSAGVGWMISNEKFWEKLKPVINNLKLRYSYGLVGNDRIGNNSDRFFYLSQIRMDEWNRGARFGENIDNGGPGTKIDRYANDAITWETATKQNYAVELGLFNKLNIIAEYFSEYRSNILMTRTAIPATMGLQAEVKANVGEAASRGIDIQMDYRQSWNTDFWTAARMNFTYATSQYKVYEEPEYKERWRSRIGGSLSQMHGYIAERLFMDDAEAQNAPPQLFGGEYRGGDIKYTDINGDMQITPADMVPVGNPQSPEIIYGFGLSAGYKGFDVSVFFQGLANESFWINASSTAPFQGQTQLLKAYADSHWSEEHQDMYALWPRLSPVINPNNVQTSTWFMRDGSFLRLKQAEIGYTIQGSWQQKLHIHQLRFYVSGTNLLLFSKFKLWDVEMAGDGLGYPIQRVFNIGLNLTFN
ncbi:MAG: TonB-dependent receptor [Tannerella sp.]|jgi:TonB-linked SusC/RagA family outer membrane protein|nr:TonB-dependent receptor [Tannerella sp.]